MDGKDTGDYPLLATDFVQVLQMRAAAHGADAAFTILSEDGRVADAIDYAGLDRRASAVAALVRQHCAPGDRVLLLLPTGIDYVAAFFGVLNAGAIAVPLFLPANRRHLDRLHGIAQDCKPTLALGEAQAEALSPVAKQALDELAVSGVPWVSLDGDALGSGDAGPASSASAVGGDGPVLLQYTSGSTGVAKGVMVTHDNLMHNAQATFLAGRGRRSDVSVSWLPLFHDMGLMLGVLQPVFGGMHAVLMQPASFLRRPYRWLRAISDFRATISTAPNFAFDQCVDNVTDAELSTLDLSAWRRAGVSAEPIRANTLRRFSARFQAAGFRAANFAPSYGLAESTLVVTMPKLESPLHVLRASRDTLAQDARLVASADDDAYELVGCGEPVGQLSVAIVNPETCRALPEGAVGEIWVHGPSVAQGYWNQQEATQERFCASLADADRQPWMRTGDLGALVGGELMVNGRIDDLMQIRGRSVFPQDVERAAA